MERYSPCAPRTARIRISIVFLLNAVGIIDQTISAKEMVERGVPAQLIPGLILACCTLELVAGLSLSFGVYPRFAALTLLAFLVPATELCCSLQALPCSLASPACAARNQGVISL
jgi:uncharacterized membrane protein YphA (DoxX/SURF4 family)